MAPYYHCRKLGKAYSQQLKAFLTEPELWDRISEDGQSADDFEVIFHPSVQYVGLFSDSALRGVLLLHWDNATTMTAHINIHRQHRGSFAKPAGRLCLEYVVSCTEADKINTSTPTQYKDVIRWLGKLGFVYEGVDRLSLFKGGRLVTQLRYGITREEILEVLQWPQQQL